MMDRKHYRFSSWMKNGILPLVATICAAAIVLHIGFEISWEQLAAPSVTVLGIQLGALLAIFFAREYFLTRNDIRPGIAVSGCYMLLMVVTCDHFAFEWRLTKLSEAGKDARDVLIITAILILVVTFAFPRYAGKQPRMTDR
jgi:hypothetical protein